MSQTSCSAITSASMRRRVSAMAGWRCSHGPKRHHTFQVATRSRVSMRSAGSMCIAAHAYHDVRISPR